MPPPPPAPSNTAVQMEHQRYSVHSSHESAARPPRHVEPRSCACVCARVNVGGVHDLYQ